MNQYVSLVIIMLLLLVGCTSQIDQQSEVQTPQTFQNQVFLETAVPSTNIFQTTARGISGECAMLVQDKTCEMVCEQGFCERVCIDI